MMTDYIDDDRDVIQPEGAFLKSIDEAMERAEVERGVEIAAAANKDGVGATVSIGTEHVQAEGWWQRTKAGAQSWGARIRAVWGRR